MNPLAPIPGNFEYRNNDFAETKQYKAYASQFPESDSPEIFGLHPNADLTFRVKEVCEDCSLLHVCILAF